MSILQISVCIPEWQAVIWEASWMKWWRRDFCSEDSDEKGSTGRVRRWLFVGEVGDDFTMVLALPLVVYINSPGEYSTSSQHSVTQQHISPRIEGVTNQTFASHPPHKPQTSTAKTPVLPIAAASHTDTAHPPSDIDCRLASARHIFDVAPYIFCIP